MSTDNQSPLSPVSDAQDKTQSWAVALGAGASAIALWAFIVYELAVRLQLPVAA